MTAAEMGMAIGLSIGVIVFVMVGTVSCYFYLKTRERYRDLAWWRLALLAFGMIQGLLSAFGIVLLIVFRGAEDFSDLVSEWFIGSVWTATILFAGLCFTREARQKPGVVSAEGVKGGLGLPLCLGIFCAMGIVQLWIMVSAVSSWSGSIEH